MISCEATKTGKKRYTYVAAGGQTIARQELTDTDTEIVGWQFTDASGLSSRGFSNEELDGLGNNDGIFPNLNSSRIENAMTQGEAPTFTNPDEGNCEMDHVWVPCSMAYRALNSGAGVQCPNNNCGPQAIWFTKKDGSSMGFLMSHFMAFANGWSGNFFPPWFGLGTPQSQADFFNQAAMLARKGISPNNLLNLDFPLNFSSSAQTVEGPRYLRAHDVVGDKWYPKITKMLVDIFGSDACKKAFLAIGIDLNAVWKKGFYIGSSTLITDPNISDEQTSLPSDVRTAYRDHLKNRQGHIRKILASTITLKGSDDIPRIFIGHYALAPGWFSTPEATLKAVLIHELIHVGQKEGKEPSFFWRVLGYDDLSYIQKEYSAILKACR